MQTIEHFERNTTITKKGQVTILVEIRRALGVGPHDQVVFAVEDNQIHLKRASQGVVARTAGSLSQYAQRPAPTEEQLRDMAEEAWAKEAVERSA